MNLQTLKYFIAVADCQSITKAAEKFYVSQPALSKAIKELEEELNATLLDRSRKKITLTEEGKRCYQQASRIVELCDQMKIKVKSEKDTIKMGYLIIGHLQYFLKVINLDKYRDVLEVIPVYESGENVIKMLENGDIDIALLTRTDMGSEYKEKIVVKSKLSILVPKNHHLYNRESVTYADLNGEKIVSWDTEVHEKIVYALEKELDGKTVDVKIVARAKKMGDFMMNIRLYNRIGILSSYTYSSNDDDIKLLEITDSENNRGLALYWKKNNNNLGISKLTSIV